MELQYSKVKEILDTLPIGFYLGKNIKVNLDPMGYKNYFDPMNCEITLSYPSICAGSAALDESFTETEVEQAIRCLLYHEISHVILTPKMYVTDELNIFEDERIETILKTYYRDVNFKKFCKSFNEFDGTFKCKDARDAFFNIVRFRIGPKEFLDRVELIINKYRIMNSLNDGYTYEYRSDVEKLWLDVNEWFEKEYEPDEKDKESKIDADKSPSDGIGVPSGSSEDKDDDESAEIDALDEDTSYDDFDDSKESEDSRKEDKETGCDPSSKSKKIEDRSKEDDKELDEETLEEIAKLVEDIVSRYENKYKNRDLENQIKQILFRNSGRLKQGGGASNTYSGRLDPRSVQRDDYKWFIKSNPSGSINKFDKIKLNLFVDVSGSFNRSEGKINQLIHSLIELEKINNKFEFDVVAMGQYQNNVKDYHGNNRVLDKKDRKVTCNEGNALTKEIYDCFNKVQDKNSTVYNVVVFDGDAVSLDNYNPGWEKRQKRIQECGKNFGAFNHSNVTIISNYANQSWMNTYSPNSNNIIVESDYANHLHEHVLTALERFMR